MADEREFCPKCGALPPDGAAFCGRCGAWIGRLMTSGGGPAPAAEETPPLRTVERVYRRRADRDVDSANMQAQGFSVIELGELSGGFLRATYGTSAPLGALALPPQLAAPSRGPGRLLAVVLGLLLLVAAGAGALFLGGRQDAAAAVLTVSGAITGGIAPDQPGEFAITVTNAGALPVQSLALALPGGLRKGMRAPKADGCAMYESGEGRTLFCGPLAPGETRTITVTFLGAAVGSYSGSVSVADQVDPGGAGAVPSPGRVLTRLSAQFAVR